MAREGEILAVPEGRTYWVNATVPQVDMDRLMVDLKEKFDKYYSIRFSNYMVQDAYIPNPVVVRAGLQLESSDPQKEVA